MTESQAQQIVEQYKKHTDYYKELKPVEESKGVWTKPSPSIREKPPQKKQPPPKKNPKITLNSPPPLIQDDEYCYNCCDCPVRANWADMADCHCNCYCC
jgi:hypothetical protein